jgi:DNA-directed RNA polymerase subunit K/omega
MNSTIVSYNDALKTNNKKSVNFLTIYEKTSIIGLRKQQLVNGANSYLTDEEKIDIIDIDGIVMKELLLNKLPFMVCRTMPNGQKEYWKLEELI